MNMTEKEWQQFAAAKKLDPATGQRITEQESEMLPGDAWSVHERLGMHKRPPDPPKHWRWDNTSLGVATSGIGVAYIAMLCTAAYFIARLFGG